MKHERARTVAFLTLPAALVFAACTSTSDHPSRWDQDPDVSVETRTDQRVSVRTDAPAQPVTSAEVRQTVSAWPERPRLAALQMTAKHGPPTVCSPHALVWLEAPPFRRIMVVREEVPHDFPKPHMDFLTHTVAYEVPLERVQDVLAFDGSVLIDRTTGELSARCDLESHNVLTLNLAHAIASGEKSTEEARQAFVDAVVAELTQEPPQLVKELAFRPDGRDVAFLDEVAIDGAPRRAGTRPVEASATRGEAGSGELLGLLVALDENEVLAALEAIGREQLPGEVRRFADMLHEHHGQNLERTLALGKRLGVEPLETNEVDRLRRQGAALLATAVAHEGDAFPRAFMDAMVRAHEQGLELIDRQLLPAADAGELREHLTRTREKVAGHLEEARRLVAKL